MNEFEKKIRNKLLMRGFANDKLLNNRGLIGATIDEVILEVVKNIGVTHCCESDSEQLVCVVDYLSNFTKGKNYECKPDGKNHFEVYDDFGNWYSVHKKCFSKTELAN